MNKDGVLKNLVTDLSQLRPGDLLVRRLHNCEQLYLYHYGCYAGRDKYGIHWVFEHSKRAVPSLVPFQKFALHYDVVHEHVLNMDREAAIRRMKELLVRKPDYDEVFYNCEHAARYIAEGKACSWQIRSAVFVVGLLAAAYVLARSEAA